MNLFGYNFSLKKRAQNAVRSLPFLHSYNYSGDELSTPTDREALVSAFKNWIFVFASRNAINVASTPGRLYVAKQSSSEKLLFNTRKVPHDRMKLIEADRSIQSLPAVKNAAEIEELTEHPFLDTIMNVNPFMNMFELMELTDLFQETTGDGYWRILFDSNGIPSQFWILPAQWMRIIPDKEEFIAGYMFKPYWMIEGMRLNREEIVHFKFPSLTSVYYGMSPLSAAAEAYNIDTNMNRYENSIMKNGGRLEGYFHAESPMEDVDFERAKQELQDSFSGVDNAGKMPLLEGVKFMPFQLPPKDMNYLRGRKWTKEMLANAFGQSLGMWDENATRANSEMATYIYQRDTIKPRCVRMQEKINEKVMPLYDESIFWMFDSPVPEDKEFSLRERESNLKSYVTAVNEEREKMGLDPVWWGDSPLTQIGVMPLGSFDPGAGGNDDKEMISGIKRYLEHQQRMLEMMEARGNGNGNGKHGKKKRVIQKEQQYQSEFEHAEAHNTAIERDIDERRLEIWSKFAAQEELHESKLIKALKKLFDEQRKEILKNIKSFVRFTNGRKLSGTKDSIDSMLFSRELWNKEFSERLNELLDDTLDNGTEFGAEQLIELGAEFNIGREQVEEFIEQYNVRLSRKIWPDVNETTYQNLRAQTLDSIRADESTEELRKRIDNVMQNAIQFRSMRIARTETVRAFNAGTIEAWKISDVVEGKEWLAEFDDRTCEYCALMDGEVEALTDMYFNQGEQVEGAQNNLVLDYSSIPSPPLHANCFVDYNIPIYTSNGWKKIIDIQVGDLVLTHKKRFRKVTQLIRTEAQKPEVTKIITRANGTGRKWTLTITSNHPVLINGQWRNAGDINIGDAITFLPEECSRSGQYKFTEMIVTDTEKRIPKKAKTLYNFSVDEDESYIAKGFVVHNCRCALLAVLK